MKKILSMLMPIAASASAVASQPPACTSSAQDFLFWLAVGVNVVAIIGIYGVTKLNWVERLFKPINPPAKDKDKT